jgi:hypothetical protein
MVHWVMFIRTPRHLPLTRRRDPDYGAWPIFYGDLHVA